MDLTTFRMLHPEFQQVPDSVAQWYLDSAARQMDPSVWGTVFDDGQHLLASDMLAHSPYGFGSALITDSKESVYWAKYQSLRATVARGLLLTSSGWPMGGPWL